MFLSDVRSRYGELAAHDDIMLSVEYEAPETGALRFEDFVYRLGSIAGQSANLDKAHLVSDFARSLASVSRRTPQSTRYGRHGWVDDDAYHQCQQVEDRLSRRADAIASDPEVQRVQQLWRSYCDRYQVAQGAAPAPYHPVPDEPTRHNDYAPRDRWPSASRSRGSEKLPTLHHKTERPHQHWRAQSREAAGALVS